MNTICYRHHGLFQLLDLRKNGGNVQCSFPRSCRILLSWVLETSERWKVCVLGVCVRYHTTIQARIHTSDVATNEWDQHQSDELRGKVPFKRVDTLNKRFGQKIKSLHHHISGSTTSTYRRYHVQKRSTGGKEEEPANGQNGAHVELKVDA